MKGVTMDKKFERWTETEDELLKDLRKRKVPYSKVAIILNRTESGCKARAFKLGITLEDNMPEGLRVHFRKKHETKQAEERWSPCGAFSMKLNGSGWHDYETV